MRHKKTATKIEDMGKKCYIFDFTGFTPDYMTYKENGEFVVIELNELDQAYIKRFPIPKTTFNLFVFSPIHNRVIKLDGRLKEIKELKSKGYILQ